MFLPRYNRLKGTLRYFAAEKMPHMMSSCGGANEAREHNKANASSVRDTQPLVFPFSHQRTVYGGIHNVKHTPMQAQNASYSLQGAIRWRGHAEPIPKMRKYSVKWSNA